MSKSYKYVDLLITICRSCCCCSIIAIQALAFRAVLSIDVRSTAVSIIIIAFHVVCWVIAVAISNPSRIYTVYQEKFLSTVLFLKWLFFLLLYKVTVLVKPSFPRHDLKDFWKISTYLHLLHYNHYHHSIDTHYNR